MTHEDLVRLRQAPHGAGGCRVAVLAGVSGTGKSLLGHLLASQLGWPFDDGDDLHPAPNIAKMRAGVPLTEEDRRPWLAAVAARVDAHLAARQPAVLACSALRRSYRDFLRQGRPEVRIVYLQAAQATLEARLAARPGHFFPPGLLGSQLAAAEPPGPGEDCLVLDAGRDPAALVAAVVREL